MSDESKDYEGWVNYKTWAVNLGLANDYGSYQYWQESARECAEDATADRIFTRRENAVKALAERLKNEIEEGSPIEDASLYSDLLTAALSDVDWHEIAESWIEDNAEDILSDAALLQP